MFNNINNNTTDNSNNNTADNLFSNIFKNNKNDNNNLFANLLGDVTKGLGKGNGNSMPQGFEQIGKMMNIIKKLESSTSKNDVEHIKHEMDSFLESDLGINVNKLNDDIKKLI